MNIELLDEASAEIGEYNPVAAGLAELRRKYANVVIVVGTPKDLEEAKRVRAEIREPRYECEKIRKALKAPALAHAKLIDTEAARITAELLALETPWDEAIKAEEARKEAEKAAREAAERARVLAITERIAGIRQYVELAASCRTAERIQSLQDKMAELKIEGFEEFSDEAQQVWQQTCAKVEELLTAKLEQEQEQARIKAEQAEAAAKLAAERAEFAAQQAAAKVAMQAERQEAERVAAEARAHSEREAARERAEQDRAAAELAAQRAAFEAEAAEARAIVAAHKAKVEQERLDAELAEQAAAKQAEQARVASEVPEEPAIEAQATPDVVNAIPDTANATEPFSPSDAEVVWMAVSAVAEAYDLTIEQATERLAAVQWTL